ncbi:MAG TPA: cold-inducible protein YdjO-related protein [Paenibacillus sp.]|uniref:cold-inducible protein YdjO-related protein n=1 Tax=Paenibacillus sp. TaxID=58172 RepID=UPI0028D7B5B9|nr:cold-inducible protein YdjO-related protein [Paenibacillus sp.]HUC93924.1 cold-inducible protein YdjO-related protein [Paenibacillus sp.]
MVDVETQGPDPDKPELHPVAIWRCKDKACKAWVRQELADSDSPGCPICGGVMGRSMRHLPKLVKKHKAPPKPKDPWH